MPHLVRPSPLFNEGHVLLARKYCYGVAFLMSIWANWGETIHSIKLAANALILGYVGGKNVSPQKVPWDVVAYLSDTLFYFVFFFGLAFSLRWLLNEFSNAICETERQIRRKARERRRRLKALVSEEKLIERIHVLETSLDNSLGTARALTEHIIKLKFDIEALENRKRNTQHKQPTHPNEPIDLFAPKPSPPKLVKPSCKRDVKFDLPKF